jgi:hypothetical protein
MVFAGSANVRVTAVVFSLLLLVGFGARIGAGAGADVIIAYFYSCDKFGKSQDYFPKETVAYFNVTLGNLENDPINVSVRLSIEDELKVPIGSSTLDTMIPPGVVRYYIMSIFIPKWAFVGVATAYALLSAEGIAIDSKTSQFHIGPEDTKPPLIRLLSPGNLTYVTDYFPLAFIVDERASWTGYSLDARDNVTIAGNTTLNNLVNGSHSVVVYANDTSGNVGSSEEAFFSVSVIHDLAVVDVKCPSKEVYAGQIVSITVFVLNEGTVAEIFNTTVHANTTVIQTFAVTSIDPGNQTALVFTWDTASVPVGSYILVAQVTTSPSEIDIADNTCMSSIFNVMPRPDIAIRNIRPSKTVVGQGYTIFVNVTVENKGHYSEGFNVTAYANTTIIEQRNVTLAGGDSATITFTWSTAVVGKGNYTIAVKVPPLLGEVNIEDNTLSHGWIVITYPGDVNGDGKVDGRDTALITKCIYKYRGQLGFLPNADINDDGKIDGKDMAIVVRNFGKTWP